MKAVTVPQPRASLVAVGAATILTMDWATTYRGSLAIHAAKQHPFNRYPPGVRWRGGGWALWYAYAGHPEPGWTLQPEPECSGGVAPLPLGAIVALCELVDVVPIVGPDDQELPSGSPCLVVDGSTLTLWGPPDYWHNEQDEQDVSDQSPYGDFRPGRYAWQIRNVLPLDLPIKRRGHGGLWESST